MQCNLEQSTSLPNIMYQKRVSQSQMSEPQTHTAVTVYFIMLQHCINCWERPQKCLTEEPVFSVRLKPGTLCNMLLHQLRCTVSWIRKNIMLKLQVSMSLPWRHIDEAVLTVGVIPNLGTGWRSVANFMYKSLDLLRKELSGTLWIWGWVSNVLEKRTFSCPCHELNPGLGST